jgi:hypothetical protein
MSVSLRVSEELLTTIGEEQFEAYLRLFDATVVEKAGPDRFSGNPFEVVYRLDVPGAPEGAAEVFPVFENVRSNGNVSVRLHSIEWWDANGRHIQEAADV